jgi:hypothetical protein
MIPTNPVASDDDGFDYYEDMPCPLLYMLGPWTMFHPTW